MLKCFSFFNEKGGVGKTVHTVMFASYLRYRHGAEVCVLDFENPNPRIKAFRDAELKVLQDEDSPLTRFMARQDRILAPFDIVEPLGRTELYTPEYLDRLERWVFDFLAVNAKRYDYVLFDFPALMMKESPAFRVCCNGSVQLVAIPMDVDNMSRKSAIITAAILRKNGQSPVLFWNNVSPADIARDGWLGSGEDIFTSHGFEVLPERIKSFRKASRESDDILFVRSTVCWPERYVEMACPQIIALYEDLKGRLDRI